MLMSKSYLTLLAEGLTPIFERYAVAEAARSDIVAYVQSAARESYKNGLHAAERPNVAPRKSRA